MEHMIHISASPKQLSRLRKGHKVRIKANMQGTGFNLLVHPETYNLATKTFNKGKGMEIQLSPQEIMGNQDATPHMEGTGIFGPKFDRFLQKRGLRDTAYKIGDQLKPGFKAAVMGGIATGAAGLAGLSTFGSGGTLAPLAAYIPAGAAGLAYMANEYIDNPDKYHNMYSSNIGGPRNVNAAASLAGQVAQNEILKKMNQETGNKYGALSQASVANAAAHKASAMLDKMTIKNQHLQMPNSTTGSMNGPVSRSYDTTDDPYSVPSRRASSPPRKSRVGMGLHRKSKGEIGSMGRFVVGQVEHLPQALLSQPFSANFQFQHTLPPAYQKFSKGTMYA